MIIKNFKKLFFELFFIVFGTAVIALGIHMFTVPNSIAPGGVTGISTVLNFITGIPVGTLYFLLNIPLIVAGFLKLGRIYVLKVMLSVVLFTVFVDYLFAYIPIYRGDMLLAAVFGGALIGVGMGIVLSRNASSGGTDIIANIIRLRHQNFRVGKLIFFFDILIITVAAVVYGELESALYAIISVFVTSYCIDWVIFGFERGTLVFIISKEYKKISQSILGELNKGVTLLSGKGGFFGEESYVLMCAIKSNKFYKLKEIVKKADQNAFVMATETSEILGNGFKEG